MNLQARMALWTLSLLVGALVSIGLALYSSERYHLYSQSEKSNAALLSSFAQACRDAAQVHDDLAAVNASRSLRQSAAVLEAGCEDREGRQMAILDEGTIAVPSQSQLVALSPGVERRSWRNSEGERLAQWSKVEDGKTSFRASVTYSQSALDREVEKALRDAAGRWTPLFLTVMGFGVVGSFLLARSLTRPILQIASGTHAVAQGRLDHRIALKRSDELGRLAADFDRMALRLSELDRMKEDFVANVTHELRSPLAAIESYAVQIANDVRAGKISNAGENLTIVRNNATRLGRFINDLLDVAKIEAKGLDVHPTSVKIADIFREVTELFAAKAKEKSIALNFEAPPELMAWADADKLHQSLTNLVGNALKFTPTDGRVTLSGRAEAGTARLSVSDTGPGLASADQKRIFNRFEQASSPGKGPKGTGLGLTITKGLVEAQGGRMELASEMGRGSIFTILLPAKGPL